MDFPQMYHVFRNVPQNTAHERKLWFPQVILLILSPLSALSTRAARSGPRASLPGMVLLGACGVVNVR
jgi:hypothetical protein